MDERTDRDKCITAAELAGYGITPADVRRRCPLAIERIGLNGEACWLREDLVGLLGDGQIGGA